jgi:hypothetical protein
MTTVASLLDARRQNHGTKIVEENETKRKGKENKIMKNTQE